MWEASAAGLPVTVLRTGPILSTRDTAHWGPATVRQVARGEVNWHPEDVLPWVHAENLAEMLLITARAPHAVGQAYNCVDGHFRCDDWYGEVARWLGVSPSVPDREPRRLIIATEKIQALGYRPRRSLAEFMTDLAGAATQRSLLQEFS